MRVPLLALALAGCHAAPRPAAPGDLVIRNVTLVSPERAAPLAHATVVVRGGRILSVDTAPPRETSGVTVVDGAGRWLVPGLIDGHVHLAMVPGLLPGEHAELAEAYFEQLPRSYLYFGFTVVVDLNVVDRARLTALRKAPLRPEILDCGGGLALANGYPMSFLPSESRFDLYPSFLYDPRQAGAIPASQRAEDHTPEAAVDRAASSGAVCIKTYWESGFGPDRGKLPTPTEAQIRDVVAAAHRRGLPVLLHANSLAAHRFAVATRVDAVVHGLWNWEGPEGALTEDVRRVLADQRAAGIGLMPTLRVIGGLEDLFVPEFLEDPALAQVLPPALLGWYRSEEGHWFAREMAADFDGLPAERIRAIIRGVGDRGRLAAVAFVADGGKLLFGSDTPSAPTYANPPGLNGYLEMVALERAGIAPRRIFEAATRGNAALFGLTRDYGTIEPGKQASLLLLGADPLVSVTAFDKLEAVILPSGRMVSRGDLAAR